jgi:hypothetical protein
LPFVGGLLVAGLMLHLLKRFLVQKPHFLKAIVQSGLLWVLANAVAVAAFSLLASFVVSFHSSPSVSLAPFVLISLLMGMSLYGMGLVIQGMPLTFLVGGLAGAYAAHASRQEQVGAVAMPPAEYSRAEESLICGVAGLVLIFVPVVGTTISLIGLIIGLRTLRSAAAAKADWRTTALAGSIMGAVGVLFFVFSAVVFLAARMGLLRAS